MTDKQAHTAEPWTVDGLRIGTPWNITGAGDEDVALVAQRSPRNPDHERDANAARIVACVNGCAGLDPAALPALIAAAELAASCRNVDTGGPCSACRTGLRSALAALRGSK